MGELVGESEAVFVEKRIKNQRAQALATIFEINTFGGQTKRYGYFLSEYARYADRISQGDVLTIRQHQRFTLLNKMLDNHFGERMMDVLRAWNEAETVRKGVKVAR